MSVSLDASNLAQGVPDPDVGHVLAALAIPSGLVGRVGTDIQHSGTHGPVHTIGGSMATSPAVCGSGHPFDAIILKRCSATAVRVEEHDCLANASIGGAVVGVAEYDVVVRVAAKLVEADSGAFPMQSIA